MGRENESAIISLVMLVIFLVFYFAPGDLTYFTLTWIVTWVPKILMFGIPLLLLGWMLWGIYNYGRSQKQSYQETYTVRKTTVNYSSRPLARSPAPQSARTVPVQTPARKPVTHHRYSAASPPPPPPMPKVIPKARSKVPNSPQELLQRQQSKKTKTRVPKTGQRVPVKRALYRQLVNLTKDEATADRLLTLAILKYPERSPDWCCEKVIFDLERDRRA